MPIRILVRALAALVCLSVVSACGGGGSSAGGGGGGGGGTNVPPSFTGPTSFTFAENETVDFTLDVTDPDSSIVTIRSLAGGDAGRFVLDTTTGRIRANTVNSLLDFENPLDGNGDNVYTQTVELDDGVNTVQDTITVTITNVDEGPEFPLLGEVELNENFTGELLTFNAIDPEGAPVSGYRIIEVSKLGEPVNADRLVNAFEVDPSSGVLRVVTPFDAELEGTQDRINIAVEASDGVQIGSGGVSLRLVDLPSRVVDGIRISGESVVSPLGNSASAVGDIDGDGFPEVWVAATADEAGQEVAYLVWGAALQARLAAGASDQLIGDYAASERVRVLGDLRSATPRRNRLDAVPAGDVDDDGIPDLLVLFREVRDFGQIEDVDNGPTAALLWGSDLAARRPAVVDLNALSVGTGVALGGLTRPFASRLNAAHADFDGDGRSDLVIGTPDRNRSIVVFGGALSPASASFDMGAAGNDAVIIIQSEDTVRAIIQQTGKLVDSMGDITGDGVPELVIAGEGLEPDIEDGLFAVDGALIAAAKGNTSVVNISSAANDAVVIEMLVADIRIDSIDGGGDVDADGLADLAIGHYGRNGSQRVGSVVTGARLRLLFGTDAELDLDFLSRADGLAIVDTGFDPFAAGDEGRTAIRWLQDMTGGLGTELAIGIDKGSPLGRADAGKILLFNDIALVSELTTTFTVDSEQPDPARVRVLQGYGSGVQTGRSLFVLDVDGDGRTEFGTASLLAGKDDGPRDVGGLVIGSGSIIEDALTQSEGAVDLASVLVVEAP